MLAVPLIGQLTRLGFASSRTTCHRSLTGCARKCCRISFTGPPCGHFGSTIPGRTGSLWRIDAEILGSDEEPRGIFADSLVWRLSAWPRSEHPVTRLRSPVGHHI